MARPYSQDLPDRVVNSVAGGRTCRATAALFGVSVASVVKWSQRWRVSGSAAAKQMGGWRQLRLQRPCRRVILVLAQVLVDEHQALGVKPALMRLPPGAAASDVGAILLAGVQSFF